MLRDEPIAPAYLNVRLNDKDNDRGAATILGHEGRNRARALSLLQPDKPLPVLINVHNKDGMTLDKFAEISASAERESHSQLIRGPLFKCFFHAGKRYGVVKTPNENGSFDYSAEEVPHSRDIGAPT